MRHLLIIAAVFFSTNAIGDFFGPPSLQNTALSLDGNYLARIEFNYLKQNAKRDAVVIHKYDSAGRGYKKIKEIPHTVDSAHLFISNGGKFTVVAEVGRGSPGLTIYNSEGEVVLSRSVWDLLTGVEIGHTMETGSTLQWLGEGSFNYGADKFYFWGSAYSIKAVRRAPWRTLARHDYEYSYMVDLEKLSVVRLDP